MNDLSNRDVNFHAFFVKHSHTHTLVYCEQKLNSMGTHELLKRTGRQQRKFVDDFISAWNKDMNADRFDLA